MSIKIKKEQIEIAIQNTNSMASAAIELKIHFATFKRYAEKHGLYKPNQGFSGGKRPRAEGSGKIPLKEILDGMHPQYQTYKLKHRLYEAGLKKNECEECFISEWNGKSIECELDHKDGDRSNHLFDNLQILCPNCHSQTETFRFKRGYAGMEKLVNSLHLKCNASACQFDSGYSHQDTTIAQMDRATAF